ncbi:MAG: hypothetical protein J7574_06875 [Flavobacterium sp.]|uniref:hypothetical protein n=1 Tax=Flavobacterium sp. TaxID=239 RepID=UPI001B0AEF39|nr:hypothetical protein [Flavobacterium sp.]MBO9583865.1 hypothetical protein [Flavobacterium sp.]
MKKLFLLFLVIGTSVKGQETKDGSRLTLGIGIGANHLFKNIYDYSLTTDANYNLKITELNKNSIVVSPVIIFRLGEIKMKEEEGKKTFVEITKNKQEKELPWNSYKRLSLLLSTDLLNIQSDKISYNKQIDGGIGIGYSFSPSLMAGIFYEIKSYRQLREYIVEQYENKPIPNGTGFYNALDDTNNSLYYNKQVEGLSLKLIFNFSSL